MTRKHFIALAKAIKEAKIDLKCQYGLASADYKNGVKEGINLVESSLLRLSSGFNSQFNPDKFREACEVK